jgi:hypothetical protein
MIAVVGLSKFCNIVEFSSLISLVLSLLFKAYYSLDNSIEFLLRNRR